MMARAIASSWTASSGDWYRVMMRSRWSSACSRGSTPDTIRSTRSMALPVNTRVDSADTDAACQPAEWRRGRCQRLWQEQGGRCFQCDRPMPSPAGQRLRHRKRADAATIDHVMPLSKGGGDDHGNCVATCRACNAAKADRLPTAAELDRLAVLKGGAQISSAMWAAAARSQPEPASPPSPTSAASA
ncbi:conserved hypothetical protein [Magnetospirillum sp. UT-4]|nr:conserved hypothetical protein [Magnetospirillum sp. UT-4]